MAGRRLSGRKFLKMAALSAGVTGALGFGYAWWVEPGWVGVERVEVGLPRLDAAFDGYRVVQVSDVHADGWMTPGRLSDAVRLVNGERPDLVALIGDLVTSDDFADASFADVAPRLVGPLKGIRARDGAVAVLGNHDHWTDARLVRRVLRDGNLEDVGNGFVSVRRGGAALHVAGVLDALPGGGAAVLLAHEPDFADTGAESGRFDLQLSGH